MLFMTQMQILLSLIKIFPPSWQLMLFMTQMQILLSLVKIFPPSWQLMLFMTQMQILLSLVKIFSALLATNAFHDSDANITFLGQNFPPLGN